MAFFLGIAACCAFALHPLGAALLLRCGLTAGLRFSPRSAMALSAAASLCASLTALLSRGRAAWPRDSLSACAAFSGGTLGRALLLMLTARFTSSLVLLRAQALPLLLLCLPVWFPRTSRSSRRTAIPRSAALAPGLLALFAFVCGLIEGFFGAGGLSLYVRLVPVPIRRRAISGAALCVPLFAQAGALGLTLSCGAAQVFPGQMLFLLLAGAALGGLAGEKQRGMPFSGVHAALNILLLLFALSGLEHAYLPA